MGQERGRSVESVKPVQETYPQPVQGTYPLVCEIDSGTGKSIPGTFSECLRVLCKGIAYHKNATAHCCKKKLPTEHTDGMTQVLAPKDKCVQVRLNFQEALVEVQLTTRFPWFVVLASGDFKEWSICPYKFLYE